MKTIDLTGTRKGLFRDGWKLQEPLQTRRAINRAAGDSCHLLGDNLPPGYSVATAVI